MRLLAGLLAGQPFRSRLIGDASLSRRPMRRVIEPLTQMGAKITAEGEDSRPPLVIEGGEAASRSITLMPVASAQVKSAVLLAGHVCQGQNQRHRADAEPRSHRAHARVFPRAPAEGRPHRLASTAGRRRSRAISRCRATSPARRSGWSPPPRSRARICWCKNVGLNETRTGVLAVLLRMGAHVREIVENVQEAEPRGSIEVQRRAAARHDHRRARKSRTSSTNCPILAVAGALAQGTTIIADAARIAREGNRPPRRHRHESARDGRRRSTRREDGMEIIGGAPLHGARLESFGDHRIAMAFAIAGLFAEGETIITDTECVNTSYPGFYETLEQIIARAARAADAGHHLAPARTP